MAFIMFALFTVSHTLSLRFLIHLKCFSNANSIVKTTMILGWNRSRRGSRHTLTTACNKWKKNFHSIRQQSELDEQLIGNKMTSVRICSYKQAFACVGAKSKRLPQTWSLELTFLIENDVKTFFCCEPCLFTHGNERVISPRRVVCDGHLLIRRCSNKYGLVGGRFLCQHFEQGRDNRLRGSARTVKQKRCLLPNKSPPCF